MLILTIQHLTTIWFHDTTNKKTTPHKQKTTLLGNNTAKYTYNQHLQQHKLGTFIHQSRT